MKKIVFTIIAVVLVLGGGALAVRHYNEYQTKETRAALAAADVAAQKAATEKAAQEARINTLQKAYDNERLECEKGQAAYDLLTPFYQGQTPDPQCGPAVVQ